MVGGGCRRGKAQSHNRLCNENTWPWHLCWYCCWQWDASWHFRRTEETCHYRFRIPFLQHLVVKVQFFKSFSKEVDQQVMVIYSMRLMQRRFCSSVVLARNLIIKTYWESSAMVRTEDEPWCVVAQKSWCLFQLQDHASCSSSCLIIIVMLFFILYRWNDCWSKEDTVHGWDFNRSW